jgi:hypothetical protein
LRANGSGECPPDDRLREAIQRGKAKLDCFVASAPRNDKVVVSVGVAKPAMHAAFPRDLSRGYAEAGSNMLLVRK